LSTGMSLLGVKPTGAWSWQLTSTKCVTVENQAPTDL
jgi:hypothetical protein